MFDFEGNIVDENFILIKDEYKVLHFDEEPILFTGLTEFSYRVIASLVEEDQDEEGLWFSRYFYIILNYKQYSEFLSKKKTYLDIIKSNENVFIYDKYYKRNSITYKVLVSSIPADYLPTEESYCPVVEINSSLKYLISLKGHLADRFYALSSDLSSIQESFSNFLEKAIEAIPLFNKQYDVYQSAYVPGSFQLSFDVVPRPVQANVFRDETRAVELYNHFIRYCLEVLPFEIQSLIQNDYQGTGSYPYEDLKQTLKEVCKDAQVNIPEDIDSVFKKYFSDIIYQLEGMTKSIGKNYSEIDVFSSPPSGENIALGEIDRKSRDMIEDSILLIESFKEADFKDKEPKLYKILIYSLNKGTRKGRANIEDEAGFASSPTIIIKQGGPLDSTKYTESLHANKYVEVKAIGQWKKHRCLHLEIEFEG